MHLGEDQAFGVDAHLEYIHKNGDGERTLVKLTEAKEEYCCSDVPATAVETVYISPGIVHGLLYARTAGVILKSQISPCTHSAGGVVQQHKQKTDLDQNAGDSIQRRYCLANT